MKINNFNTYPVLNRLYSLLFISFMTLSTLLSGVDCVECPIMFIIVCNELFLMGSIPVGDSDFLCPTLVSC